MGKPSLEDLEKLAADAATSTPTASSDAADAANFKPKEPQAPASRAAKPAKAASQKPVDKRAEAPTAEASEEAIRKELKKQYRALKKSAEGLLENGTDPAACRGLAVTLDRFHADNPLLDQKDVEGARSCVWELRMKADLLILEKRIGANPATNGVDLFDRAKCETVLEAIKALGADFGFETEDAKEMLEKFRGAVETRLEELRRAETQDIQARAEDNSANEPEPSVIVEEQAPDADPAEAPAPDAQAPATPNEPNQQTTRPRTPRPPNQVRQVPQTTSEDLARQERRKRVKRWALIIGGAVVIAALLFLAVAFGGPTLWAKFTSSLDEATTEEPTGGEDLSAAETPNSPEGSDPPDVDRTPAPDPEEAPTLHCVTPNHEPRCSDRNFSITSAELDRCRAFEQSPRYTPQEHQYWWDCGTAMLGIDEDGRQDVCVPACCFCRYE